MSCSEYEELVSAYADGELSGGKEEKVKKHLEGCDSCRKEYDFLLSLQNGISRALIDCEDMPDFRTALIRKPAKRFVPALAFGFLAAAMLMLLFLPGLKHPSQIHKPIVVARHVETHQAQVEDTKDAPAAEIAKERTVPTHSRHAKRYAHRHPNRLKKAKPIRERRPAEVPISIEEAQATVRYIETPIVADNETEQGGDASQSAGNPSGEYFEMNDLQGNIKRLPGYRIAQQGFRIDLRSNDSM